MLGAIGQSGQIVQTAVEEVPKQNLGRLLFLPKMEAKIVSAVIL